MNNFPYYFMGGMLSLTGLIILKDPVIHSRKYGTTFDLTGVNIPVGIALIIFGLYIIIAIRMNAFKKKEEEARKKKKNKKESKGQI